MDADDGERRIDLEDGRVMHYAHGGASSTCALVVLHVFGVRHASVEVSARCQRLGWPLILSDSSWMGPIVSIFSSHFESRLVCLRYGTVIGHTGSKFASWVEVMAPFGQQHVLPTQSQKRKNSGSDCRIGHTGWLQPVCRGLGARPTYDMDELANGGPNA